MSETPLPHILEDDDKAVPDYMDYMDELGTPLDFLECAQEAVRLRARAKDIDARRKDNDLNIMQYMARLPEEVRSLRVIGTTITFVDSGTTRSLNKRKLKQRMVAYGVPAEEVKQMFEESMDEKPRAGSIRIRENKPKSDD